MSACAARPFSRVLAVIALSAASAACTPDLHIGDWKCDTSTGRPAVPDAGSASVTDPIAFPWSTGFEDGFCDYVPPQGYCYAGSAVMKTDGTGGESSTEPTYDLVTSPVHTGKRAAAFPVTGASAVDPGQARCVREGALPTEAYYGAWFYVSAFAMNADDWNLMHFEQGDPAAPTKLWDVSIGTTDGRLSLYLYDFAHGQVPNSRDTHFLPAQWFHVEFYWRQAADGTGEAAVYLNGTSVIDEQTATKSSTWSRWYVGNFADELTPPDSTVYVDDVSISADL